MQIPRSLYAFVTGEERPRIMLCLFALLVLLLHVWALLWLQRPAVPITPPQPLMMEVSLLAAPPAQQASTPPAPQPPVKKVVPEVKPKPKPVPKPKPPKQPPVQKALEPLPAETAAPAKPVLQPQPPAVSKPAAPPSAAATAAKSAKAEAEKITEANYRANYATNPKPEYPRIARNRGWEGKVLLKVQVSAEGNSEAVSVNSSSGHEVLDEAAVAAVEKWKFVPARRGDTPVASSVIVPIIFKLD